MSFLGELRDGITPRAALLVFGVLALQLGFIASYLGAFHDPTPRGIPISVAAAPGTPPGIADQFANQLNVLDGEPVLATVAGDTAEARGRVERRAADGAYLIGANGADRLVVASAGGATVSQALAQILGRAADEQQRTLSVEDVRPAGAGDARGLSAFYLSVGWVVGGYLVASALSLSRGARPLNARRALVRLLALAAYAGVSGAGGALLAETIFGALEGNLAALLGAGALLVFAVGAFTIGLQALTGTLGIGLTVLLFVVLGNPSAGGAYPAPMLPPFWRAVGPWLPPGAGTDAVRGIIYFDGAGVRLPALVLAGYALLGTVVTLVASAVGAARAARPATDGPARRMAGQHRRPRDPVSATA